MNEFLRIGFRTIDTPFILLTDYQFLLFFYSLMLLFLRRYFSKLRRIIIELIESTFILLDRSIDLE